ncbi:hypothetical protein ACWCPF_37910 [Streptomyces sp. NPDC001858]
MIFRLRPADDSRAAAERADEASRRLLEQVNGHQRVVLSSTVVDDRCTLRVCVVSHRTHHDRITEALQIITAEAKRHTTAQRSPATCDAQSCPVSNDLSPAQTCDLGRPDQLRRADAGNPG